MQLPKSEQLNIASFGNNDGGSKMKYCKSCKKYFFSDDLKYCTYCGREFESTNRNMTEKPVPKNKPKKTITVQEAYEWGEKFYYGNGVEKNLVKALIMYLKAAEKGHVEAQYSAGYMYYYGEGTDEDYEEAFKWCLKAANQGHAKARFLVADMYSFGNGVDKNLRNAFSWYKKAAEQNHDRAQFELGNMYLRGICVKSSYKKAIERFQKAADNGNRDAKRLLKDLVWDDKKTLFVYKGNNYCVREHHDIISATAVLNGRNNPHIELDVDYCMKCHKFLINMIEYDLCRERNHYLLGRILFDTTSSERDTGNGFSPESPLSLHGYNVNAQNELTEEERHLILAEIIDQRAMTKTEIKDYLNRFVAFNGSKEGNEKARQKWKCDLDFTKEYRKKEQPKVTITDIRKHKTHPETIQKHK